MSKHNNIRTLECAHCAKKFKTKASLEGHIKTLHSDRVEEKQFVCGICSRSYFHKRHLDYHLRKHNNDRRYECDKCDKSFFYSDAVKWHKIRFHNELAPFFCGKDIYHSKLI